MIVMQLMVDDRRRPSEWAYGLFNDAYKSGRSRLCMRARNSPLAPQDVDAGTLMRASAGNGSGRASAVLKIIALLCPKISHFSYLMQAAPGTINIKLTFFCKQTETNCNGSEFRGQKNLKLFRKSVNLARQTHWILHGRAMSKSLIARPSAIRL